MPPTNPVMCVPVSFIIKAKAQALHASPTQCSEHTQYTAQSLVVEKYYLFFAINLLHTLCSSWGGLQNHVLVTTKWFVQKP